MLYTTLQNCYEIRCNLFRHVNVLIFCQFDFKVPIHGPIKNLSGARGNGMGGEAREARQGKGEREGGNGIGKKWREGDEV